MSLRPGSMGRFTALRALAQRFAFAALVLVALGLMLLGRADAPVVESARTAVADAVSPALAVFSRPANVVAETVTNLRELAELRRENARLREANARLQHWQTVARRLRVENKRLRDLLNFVPMPGAESVSARVIADTGGSFARSVIVAVGREHGVEVGEAVATGEGLVGRVEAVGRRSARVLLLTDLNSRVPVKVQRTGAAGMLAGDNANRPRLLYADDSRVKSGDRIVTSGDGGAFPPGLPVGVVVSAGKEDVRVDPFVRRSDLAFVRVIDYGLDGILKQERPDTARDGS